MIPTILGVPWEEGTYWRKGAKQGPRSVKAELEKLRPISISTGRGLDKPVIELYEGELELSPYSWTASFEAISTAVSGRLEDGVPTIAVGGDHSISYPIIKEYSRHFGRDRLIVIQLDAHSDTFPAIAGFDYHHGATFRKLVEDGFVRASHLYQFGIRGTVREGGLDFVNSHAIHCISMQDWRRAGLSVAKFLPKAEDCYYYLSFDIDAVDPAFAPGTGTPVPGGLSSYEALELVRSIGKEYPLVGADFVEVAPVYDPSGITALLAAHLISELLAHARFVALAR